MARSRQDTKGTQKPGDGSKWQMLGLPRELDDQNCLAVAGLVLSYFALSPTGVNENLRYCLHLTLLWACEVYESPSVARLRHKLYWQISGWKLRKVQDC